MNYSQGIATPLIIGALAFVLAAGVLFFQGAGDSVDMQEQSDLESVEAMEEDMAMEQVMKDKNDSGDDAVMVSEGTEITEGIVDTSNDFIGTVLAGNSAPLLEFSQADYEKALTSKKVVALFFFANWCPTCKKEFPLMQSAFDSLKTNDVVGFRVNYNDNETSGDEKALAREFGVAYQHTKVFLKNGERVLKSPETWNEERYVEEITTLLQ